MSTIYSLYNAAAVEDVDGIVSVFLAQMSSDIDKTLNKIAFEMLPKEICTDEQFKEYFLKDTIDR